MGGSGTESSTGVAATIAAFLEKLDLDDVTIRGAKTFVPLDQPQRLAEEIAQFAHSAPQGP